ncbi:D-alanyl-D-alanine carboxypeptidase family protein [Tabrizicola flagellatus]|uniref:D-alanyl-D-alanine carboxypeptidase family protein n=1 Tax=Tabrizicola flagellatus TaxID=2593021 RepID=UPI0011F32952|nr:D-alanyl-D-alanine carboxypeptidase family protein [Tabrizicola flagellatus]
MILVVAAVVATSPLQAAPFAAIVMDGRTGEVLYEKNAHARLHPASLTKMMTLYIAFQEIEAGRLSLDTMVTVSKYAASQPPSRLGLKPGQRISMRHLIRAAAIKSANDAASAIGDHISGDAASFAKRMTRTARQLGMNNTTFKNANGLTAEGHLSTAYDMNVLGRHLFYDFPQYYHIFSRRTADAGIATVTNTNSRFLDSYEGADGIKTGYTGPAGFNLTASARRGDKHIIATVFGGTSSANRNAKMAELMDIGFARARNGVKEQPPKAAPIEDALVASLETGIDEIDAVGGAGKTVRVSGEVKKSLRPKARPTVPTVPDAVAVAMAEGIEGALAEATAAPAPEGTLDFQAQAMAAAEQATADPMALAETAIPPAEDEAAPETLLAEAAEPAAVPAVLVEPGTLDAQAAALAAPAGETVLAEAVAPEPAPEAALEPVVDPALAAFKPKARPEAMAAPVVAAAETEAIAPAVPAAEPVAQEVVLAEVQPELVVTDPGLDPAATDAPAALLAEVTDVESVAGATALAPPSVSAAPAPDTVASAMPKRQAPIFDTIETADMQAEDTGTSEEVVVVMSTSGGRHFGVNVGEYSSRYEADKALLKTALAESATLNEGNRRAIQSGGKWRASFMGLTEEQAQLACRRLMARAIPCETVGG